MSNIITPGFILVILTCLFVTLPFGETLKCYHCYQSFNNTLSVEDLNGAQFGSKFVRCDKNKSKWNTWDCPFAWPVCIIMNGKVGDHYEIVRSCGQKNFCSKYIPPAEVRLDSCRECNTTLCNDYSQAPDIPEGPLFVFNININLNVKKLP